MSKAIIYQVGGYDTTHLDALYSLFHDDGTAINISDSEVDSPFLVTTAVADMSESEYVASAIAAVIADASSTHSITITENDIIWAASPANRKFATPSRTLDSAFQISAFKDAQASYMVDVTVSSATGTVTLQYADDSGFTTNVVTMQSAENSGTGTVTLNVGGIIPAGKYVKIETAQTSGSPTFAFRSAQEVLL